jgi:hypothetical protein
VDLDEQLLLGAAGLADLPSALRVGLDPPVEVFRVWSVWRRDKVPWLRSLVVPAHRWLPGEVIEAQCFVEPGSHDAPHPGCRCGVYGLRTRASLEPYLSGHGSESRLVVGKVALWGPALAGRFGWRALFGRLLEIIALPHDGGLAQEVASMYGVPALTSLPPESSHP